MRLRAIRSAAASTASLVALYALVASCSTNMGAERASLDGEWMPVRESAAAPVKLAVSGGAMQLHTSCAAVEATLDRAGRLRASSLAAACEGDREVMAFVERAPELVRIDARTVELRRGRQRVRFRKA